MTTASPDWNCLHIDRTNLQFDTDRSMEEEVKLKNVSANRLAIRIKCTDTESYRVDPVHAFLAGEDVNRVKIRHLVTHRPADDNLVIQYVTDPDSETPQKAFEKNKKLPQRVRVRLRTVDAKPPTQSATQSKSSSSSTSSSSSSGDSEPTKSSGSASDKSASSEEQQKESKPTNAEQKTTELKQPTPVIFKPTPTTSLQTATATKSSNSMTEQRKPNEIGAKTSIKPMPPTVSPPDRTRSLPVLMPTKLPEPVKSTPSVGSSSVASRTSGSSSSSSSSMSTSSASQPSALPPTPRSTTSSTTSADTSVAKEFNPEEDVNEQYVMDYKQASTSSPSHSSSSSKSVSGSPINLATGQQFATNAQQNITTAVSESKSGNL